MSTLCNGLSLWYDEHMKYHLDTIPVWDAYRHDSECPLCDLRAKSEQSYVENFLGGSVMEPAVRLEVNAKGFCGRHFAQMFGEKNRLGLALMTHTHLQESMKDLSAPQANKRGLFRRTGGPAADAADHDSSCVLCERLDHTMNRYLYTVLHLWKTDTDFRETLEASKGLCLPHYRQLLHMAGETLGAKDAAAFSQMLETVERENLARIEKELEWFTLKFDYRNGDKPWGTSRDSLQRAINKLRGRTVTSGE